jgi:hypothetical protein
MARHALEVADIVRRHGEEFAQTHALTLMQRRVLRSILRCRTAELGGHVYRCEGCSYEDNSYNSCRDRHCPKCQGGKAKQWAEDRIDELLPVSYFHTVFTLPHQLHALTLSNQRLMYDMLFQAVSRTLLAVGERKLHAKLGFLCLLHTWGQTLTFHPHLHVLIPGCGIDSRDGSASRFHARYLLSDKVLSRVFRGKFVALLKRAYRNGKLHLNGDLQMLANEHQFEQLLNEATAARWVVRTRPPFSGPTVVLKYLARYTQRVAIANSRLLSLEDGYVSFTYRDYRQGGISKVMRLSASDFLSRFVLHVLPKSFVRVRYYGFLSRGSKAKALELFRAAFGASPPRPQTPLKSHSHLCPRCHAAPMQLVAILAPLLPLPKPQRSSAQSPPPHPCPAVQTSSQAA